MRGCLLAVVLVASLGCKNRDQPAAPAEPPAESPPTAKAVDPVAARGEEPEPTERSPAAAEEPSAAAPAQAPAPASPPRDLETELREAVGSPADCIRDYRPASARTMRIQIGAVVRPTGMVIEPSASGAGLSTNDRRCIEERVGAVVLEPFPGGSSQTVSTYVEMQYSPTTVKEDDVATPPPPPENVVQALPKKKPIAPSGVPIEGPAPDPIEGPDPVPIDGPQGVPIEGPDPVPIGTD